MADSKSRPTPAVADVSAADEDINSTTPAKVNTFIQKFIKSYQGHGGKVVNPTPEIMWANGLDGGKIVENLFNKTGNANKKRPELMIFILENKNADMYNRIKKSADCRYGVVSQCVQSAHVNNNNLQYHSNLCMKVNAKLGGTTSRVAPVSHVFLFHSTLTQELIIRDRSPTDPFLSMCRR